jgi:hypothetical protein
LTVLRAGGGCCPHAEPSAETSELLVTDDPALVQVHQIAARLIRVRPARSPPGPGAVGRRCRVGGTHGLLGPAAALPPSKPLGQVVGASVIAAVGSAG